MSGVFCLLSPPECVRLRAVASVVSEQSKPLMESVIPLKWKQWIVGKAGVQPEGWG